METWELFEFKTKESFESFKQEFGKNWGMMLLMINPIKYGKIISEMYGIPSITFNTLNITEKN